MSQEGHPFYGNQWTVAGTSNETAKAASAKADKSGSSADHLAAYQANKVAADVHRTSATEAYYSNAKEKQHEFYNRGDEHSEKAVHHYAEWADKADRGNDAKGNPITKPSDKEVESNILYEHITRGEQAMPYRQDKDFSKAVKQTAVDEHQGDLFRAKQYGSSSGQDGTKIATPNQVVKVHQSMVDRGLLKHESDHVKLTQEGRKEALRVHGGKDAPFGIAARREVEASGNGGKIMNYESASAVAKSYSDEANTKNTPEAHRKAAGHQRIAAEHAKMEPTFGHKSNEHDVMSSRHARAADAIEACKAPASGSAVMKPYYASAAVVAKLGEISGKRMSLNKALEASITENGFSLNTFQEAVRVACLKNDKLTKVPDRNEGGASVCGGCYVADIVAPAHEAGETWKAIVNGADGKLYAVQFTIGVDKSAALVGDPAEVQRTTDYEYVAGMEAEARAAVEAGSFNGNQHKASSDVADEHSAAARVASRKAFSFSKKATDNGGHKDAGVAHAAAKAAHEDAASKHASAGNDDEADDHKAKAAKHAAKADDHNSFGQVKAKDATEVLALEAKTAELCRLDCSRTTANAIRSLVAPNAVEAGYLMYMPEGEQTITPSCGGRPVTVNVKITPAAATALETQRQRLTASGKKPFLSVLHDSEVAAFWPSRFSWDTRLDATGEMRTGVWADGGKGGVEGSNAFFGWTKAGIEAVEGKNIRTFSPTFWTDASIEPANPRVPEGPLAAKYAKAGTPAEVVCATYARANMGALENDPAFQNISPLWCRNAATSDGKTVPLPAAVRACHDELRASGVNPFVAHVRREVKLRHGLALTESEVIEALNATKEQ